MPKKKGNRNKKKQSNNDPPSHIAAAIMPSTGLAAAPRSPITMVTEPEGSGTLSTSLLGRSFHGSPEPETQPSETDTSLCDYDNAMGTLNPRYRLLASGSRSLPYTHPHTTGHAPGYSTLPERSEDYTEGSMARQHAVPLTTEAHAEPQGARPLSQMTGVSEFTEVSSCDDDDDDSSPRYVKAYERTIQENLRESYSQNETLHRTRTPMDQTDGDMILTHQSTLRSHTPQDLMTSAKMRELQQINLELLRKQKELQEQLQRQQAAQTEILEKLHGHSMQATINPDQTLTQEIASIMQETTSVTDKTSRQHTQLIQCLHQRTDVLEEQKEELREVIELLRVDLLKKQSEAPVDDQMRLQLVDLKNQNDVLRSNVHRLTAELGNSQAQRTRNPQFSALPPDGPTPSWVINHKFVAPLFVAYDDQIKQKNDVIHQYESEFQEIQERIEVIIEENNRLQNSTVDQLPANAVRKLREQCALVIEENQNMIERLTLQEEKYKQQQLLHHQQVSELSQRVSQAEAERSVNEREIVELRLNCKELKERNQENVIDREMMDRVSIHLKEVEDLKRITEDERLKNISVIEKLESDLKCSQLNQQEQSQYVQDVLQKCVLMEKELKNYRKASRKSQKAVLIMQKAISTQKTDEHVTSKYLNKVVKVAEQTALERDGYIQAIQSQELQSKKAMDEVIEGKLAVTQMHEKLQAHKKKSKERVEKFLSKLQDQEKAFLMERSEFEREMKHLRLQVIEKDNSVNTLENEKSKIQDDLESVWRATTADNRRMRDTFNKNVEKLRKHKSLTSIIDSPETGTFNIEDYLTDQCG